ncbi:MAG: DUF6338 family protein [Actinomycetota bacterium]|nr:DUF6338 family protein [Actinomycetota bacterium]
MFHARAHVLEAWTKQTPIDVLGVGAPVAGVIALVYFVFSPVVGIGYALMQNHRPYVWFARAVFSNVVSSHAQPEVWDRLFSGAEERPWVIVWFKSQGAIGGSVQFAGVSPSSRQLLLVPSPGVPQSLVRFDQSGQIVEDLTAKAEGIWVDVSSEVVRVEILR